jgi:hypothetical protein
MSEQEHTPAQVAAIIMHDLEARGATFRWRDAEQHDFTCCLDGITDWDGLPSDDVVAQVVLEHRDEIRALMRACQRAH